MYDKMQTVEGIFKEFARQAGLSKGEIKIVHSSIDFGVYVNFGFRLDYVDTMMADSSPQTFVDKVFRPLIDDIQNSEAVTDAKYDLNAQVEVLKKRIDDLEQNIRELKPFKTHYELEFKLKHGKNK
jgi:hypothetical protein